MQNNPSTHHRIHPSASKVCVIGLGYIGLPTAALLANRSYHVHGVDVVQSTVDIINRGEIHIVEPELDTFVKAAVNSGKLKADIKPTEADIFIIAVPTPFHKPRVDESMGEGVDEGSLVTPVPNVDFIVSATEAIAPYIKEGDIVILESTSPVGTTDMMEGILKEHRPELFGVDEPIHPSTHQPIDPLAHQPIDTSTHSRAIHIAHCPERVLPGHIMRELVENDRIVGGTTPEATKATAEFYKTFVDGEVLETNAKTAEMAKLTENSFRDTNIAFANELSILCDKFDIDVWELIALANRHPRVNILQPGAGVGGHCIAVDPWFIVHAGGEDAKMIRTAREVNTYKTEWVIEKIKNAALEWKSRRADEKMSGGGDASIHSPVDPSTHIPIHSHAHPREPKIAIFGLAFKPDIDDLRESPALYIAKRLTAELENVICVEPNIPLDHFTIHHPPSTRDHQPSTINHQPKLVDLDSALAESDIQVFLVAHKEFKDLDIETDLDFCGVSN